MIAEQELSALVAGNRDAPTERHAHRVGESARRLGMRLGLVDDDLDALYQGGIIHDIGKIGVSEGILNKTGPLDFEERMRIEAHPVIGESMVAPISSGSRVLPIIRHHHERFDGRGYPDGLRGKRIPLLARINEPEAIVILREGAGRQWDPELVELFVQQTRDPRNLATA